MVQTMSYKSKWTTSNLGGVWWNYNNYSAVIDIVRTLHMTDDDDLVVSGWGEVDDMREELLKDWGELLEKWDGRDKTRPSKLVNLCRKVVTWSMYSNAHSYTWSSTFSKILMLLILTQITYVYVYMYSVVYLWPTGDSNHCLLTGYSPSFEVSSLADVDRSVLWPSATRGIQTAHH